MFDLMLSDTFFGGHMFDILKRLDREFIDVKGPQFVLNEKKDRYNLEIPMEKYSAENVKIHLDYDRVLCVDSVYKTDNSTKTYSFSETIPDDADPATVRAKYDDGKIKVSLNVIAKEEPAQSREIPVHRCHGENHKGKNI